MDKCREEFDSYMLKSGYTVDVLSKSNHYDCYHDVAINAMYSAWKASRESMKAIKLPETLNICSESSRDKAIKECKEAITSAGYEVE